MTQAIRVLLTVALLAPAVPSARQGPAPATVKEVMTSMTIPGSDAIFNAASEPPQTEAQWAALRKGAETVAASGRLLTTARLARDTTTWMEMARAMVAQAEAVVKIADAKARDRIETAGDEVYATCESCHGRYLQQP